MGDRLACRDAASPLGARRERGRDRRGVRSTEVLGLPRAAVCVVTGELSRHKTIRVDGMSPEEVTSKLVVVLSSPAHEPGQEAR